MASNGLPTTSYAVLGLLSIAPMSGYDVARAGETVLGVWPMAKSQVYGELTRLEQLGHIRARDVAQVKLPNKRVFQLTRRGEAALDEWVVDSEFEPSRLRVPFLAKLLFGHRMAPSTVRAQLAAYKAAAEADVVELQALVDDLDAVPKAAYSKAAALYLLRVTEAAVAWADEVGPLLPKRQVKLDPRRAPGRAAALLQRGLPRRRS